MKKLFKKRTQKGTPGNENERYIKLPSFQRTQPPTKQSKQSTSQPPVAQTPVAHLPYLFAKKSDSTPLVLLVLSVPNYYIIVDLLLIMKEYLGPIWVTKGDLIDMHQEVGKGDNAVVRLTKHYQTNKLYAVKRYFDAVSQSSLEAIGKAVQNWAPHCNLLTLESTFYKNGRVYVIQEYMDRGSLAMVYKAVKGPLPEDMVKYIAAQLCSGLEFLHSRQPAEQVHSVEPTRILLDSDGKVKLSDFWITPQNKMEVEQFFHNRPLMYMSPERIRGLKYENSSDVWSLGMLCAELCLGRTPVSLETSFLDMLNSVTNLKNIELPNCTHDCSAWINSCLNHDPKQRPTVSQLMNHKWLQNNNTSQQAFAKWLQAIPQLN